MATVEVVIDGLLVPVDEIEWQADPAAVEAAVRERREAQIAFPAHIKPAPEYVPGALEAEEEL